MRTPLGDEKQIFSEVVNANSSVLGITSMGYSMDDCDRITFVVAQGTAAAAATAISPMVQVVQSGDVSLSTNTSVSGASTRLGPTTANAITNARMVTITLAVTTTGAETIALNGSTLTVVGESTLVSTVSSGLAFGSSIASSVNTGLTLKLNSLASVINNSTLSYYMTAATVAGTTDIVTLTAKDTASTGITAATSGTEITLTSNKAFAIFEVGADDLDSTSQYVGISITSAATAAQYAVTVIKDGLRQIPEYQTGQAHKYAT